ncbi:MAG: VOC family protein, partial [Rhodospirillales bacterium]
MANNAPQKTTSISVESLDHISIAVPDLAQAIDLYREKFGCVVSNPMELPEQGIRIAYVGLGNAKLELMEPLGSSSPISKFLENHPAGGLHHFCLTTNDVSEAAATANNSGMRV